METIISNPKKTLSEIIPAPTLPIETTLAKIQGVFQLTIQEGATIKEQQEACFSAAFRASKKADWKQIEQTKEELTTLTDKLGRSLLQRAIDESEIEIAYRLIENRIGLHQKSTTGDTALHRAARLGNIDLIAKLYEHSHINAQNHKGQTPLHVAILSGQYEVVAALLINGANPNIPVQWSILEIKPLALAALRGEIKCLEQLLVHKEVNIKEITHSIGTLLHVAVHFSQLSVIEYLFHNHVDDAKPLLEEKDAQGRSPLCLATVLDDPAAVVLLHARGGDIESEDNQGRRPIHYAATALNQNLIQLLYYFDANLSAADSTNRQNRPLDLIRKMPKSSERSSTKKLFANLMERAKGEENAPPQFSHRPPKNIVFKGGGPKGIAYVGAIRELEKEGMLREVERYAGASAGAITATLLAIGYSSEKTYNLLAKTDLFSFLDFPLSSKKKIKEAITNISPISATVKLLKNTIHAYCNPVGFAASVAIESFKTLWHTPGLCEGEEFRLWMEDRISKKTKIKDCTFEDLRRLIDQGKPFKHLHVIATKLGDSPEIAHINSEDPRWDNVVISSAVGASMSIPGVFKPCHLRIKKNGEEKGVPSLDLGTYLDGGMLNNLPVEIFDEKGYQMRVSEEEKRCPLYNKRTLGFSLYSAGLAEPVAPKSVETIGGLLKEVVGIYFHAEDLIRQQNPYNKHRVIEIDNCGVSLLNFKIKKEKQDELIESGESATHQFFERQGSVQKSLFYYPRLKKEVEGLINNFNATYPHFVGRKKFLEQLAKVLILKEWENHRATVVQALFGPGGIGKTETALTFVNSHLGDYSLVWWIDAETKESQERDYRELAQALRLNIEKDVPKAVCKKVHTCLLQREFEKPWLLIYDNLENPVEIPERGGVVLVTTRNKQLFLQPQRIEVKPFDHEDAIELFEKITQEEKSKEMEDLIKSLGNFPLVLTQVASYIAETPGMTVGRYLEKRQEGASGSRLQKDARYPKTLAEILDITLKQLQAKDSRAVRWLEICAYLNPDGIDLSYLDLWLKEVCKEGDIVERERHGEEILRLLTNYSLLRFDEKTASLSVHRSVQEALRDRQGKAYQEGIFREVVFLVLKEGKMVNQAPDWEHIKRWELHTLIVERSSLFTGIERLQQAALFSEKGKMKIAAYWPLAALGYFEQALIIQKEILGEMHPDVADTLLDIRKVRHFLAQRLHSSYQDKEALKNAQQALAIQIKTFGEVHLDVADTLSVIGRDLRALGRYEEALKFDQRALDIRIKILGEKNPQIIENLGEIGVQLRKLKRYEEALEKFQQVSAITNAMNHPLSVLTLYRIGSCLRDLKKSEEALIYFEKILALELREMEYYCNEDFSETGFPVISRLTDIESCLEDLGRPGEALLKYQETYEILWKDYGENHLVTRSVKGIIALHEQQQLSQTKKSKNESCNVI